MKKRVVSVLFLLLVCLCASLAFATGQSTINPLIPVANSPLQSLPVRNNFQAAYNDINALYGLIPGPGSLAFAAIPLTVSNGGTGLSSFGSALQCLQVNSSGTALTYGSCAAGSVTTTGSPSSGHLVQFSGPTSITTGDLSGDVTTSGSLATTLATVNNNTGSFGSSTAIPAITVNGKGLVTAASTSAVVAPAGTLTGSTLAANVTASSLTSVGSLSNLTVVGNTTLSSISGIATQCLQVNSSGLISGTGTVCGSGGASSILGTSSLTPSPYASNSDTQTGFYTAGTGNVSIASQGSQVADFSASGVGIGTANPVYGFDVWSLSDFHGSSSATSGGYQNSNFYTLIAPASSSSASYSGIYNSLQMNGSADTSGAANVFNANAEIVSNYTANQLAGYRSTCKIDGNGSYNSSASCYDFYGNTSYIGTGTFNHIVDFKSEKPTIDGTVSFKNSFYCADQTNLGTGTIAQSSCFHVEGNGANNAIEWGNGGSGQNAVIYSTGANNLTEIGTAGVVINPVSGGVSIGTTAIASNTLTVPAITGLPGQPWSLEAGGNTQAQIGYVGDGTNYLKIAGAPSGVVPYIQATGSDGGVGFTLSQKGTSPINFATNGLSNFQVKINNTTSAANYLTLTGATTGNNPTISVAGSDVSESLALVGNPAVIINPSGGAVSLGTSTTISNTTVSNTLSSTSTSTALNLQAGGNTQLQIGPVGDGTNYVKAGGGSTGVAPYLQFSGSNPNVNGLLFTKGSGSINFATNSSTTTFQASISTTGMAIGTNYAGVYSPPSNGLIVSGNVGIGSASPQASLDLSQQTDSIILPQSSSDSPNVNGAIRYNNGGTPAIKAFVNGSWAQLAVSGGIVSSGVVLGTSVTVPNPYASAGDTTTGLYTAGTGKIDLTSAGSQVGEFSSTGLNLYNGALTAVGSTTLNNLGVAPYYAVNSGVVCDGSTVINTALSHAFTAASKAGNQFVVLPASSSAASSTSTSFATHVMTVGGSLTGTFAVGQTIIANGVTNGTVISSLGTGTGGAGTYNLSTTPGTISAEYVTAIKPCIINAQINVPTGMWLIGAGMGNTVIEPSSAAPNYSMINLSGNYGGVAYLTLNGLMTTGGSGGNGGIYVNGNYNKILYDESAYTTTNGINVQDGSHNEVAYNYVHNTGTNGITVNAGLYPPAALYNWVHDNDVENSAIIGTAYVGSGDNIDVDYGASYTRVENNYSLCNDIILFENQLYGTVSNGNKIINNMIVLCPLTNYPGGLPPSGVTVLGSENQYEVSNNSVFNGQMIGLNADGAQTDFSWHDNSVYSTVGYGLTLKNDGQDPTDPTGPQNRFAIYGNRFYDTGNTSIYVTNSDTNGAIEDNYVYIGTTVSPAYAIDTTGAAATIIVKDNYVQTGTTGVINNNSNQAVYNNYGPGEGGQNYINLQQTASGSTPSIQALGSDTNIGLNLVTKNNSSINFQVNGAEQFQVANISGAVNYLYANGQTTGNSPEIAAAGSDTNVSIALEPKGTANIYLGASALDVLGVSSAVNYLTAQGATTGNMPTIASSGSDTNVGIIISTKGAGNTLFKGNGATQVEVVPTSSAVNYLVLDGQSTGNSPTLSVAGSDANIGLLLQSKGTGGIHLNTNSADQLVVLQKASAVNYLTVNGQTTGNSPTIASAGSDTNVNLLLLTQGTGSIHFNTNGNDQFVINNTSSAVNYLTAVGQTAGNNPALGVGGTDTNVSMQFSSKGSGNFYFYGNGGTQLEVSSTASAVNNFIIDGQSTGNSPTLTAAGSDANVSMLLKTQGTGNIHMNANGADQFLVLQKASAVNYLTANGQTTGNSPTLSVAGSDTNIGLLLQTQGTGGVHLNADNADQAVVTATANAVNYLTFTGAATGSPPVILTAGTDTNVGLNVQTQGSGVINLQPESYTNFEVAAVGNGTNYVKAGGGSTGAAPYFQFTGTDSTVNGLLFTKGNGAINFATNSSTTTFQAQIGTTGVAIGTGYAGVDLPTSNGLLVQGSVGIGTTSPLKPLEVYGGSILQYLSSGDNPGITVQSGSTNNSYFTATNSTGNMTFVQSNSAADITMSSADTLLTINFTAATDKLDDNAALEVDGKTYLTGTPSGSLASYYACFDPSSSPVGEISYQATNCTTSLRSTKHEIAPYTTGLKDAMALQPSTFVMNQGTDGHQEIGLIAEDTERVNSDLAGYQDGKLRTVQYDRTGVVAIAAIQEQQKEIEALKASNDNVCDHLGRFGRWVMGCH